MKNKLSIFAALAAASTLTTGSALAAEMEKCKVVDANGMGLIKEHKADCATSIHSCAGHNPAGEAEAWILVPKGECTKINTGDFSGVSADIKDKIAAPLAMDKEADAKDSASADMTQDSK